MSEEIYISKLDAARRQLLAAIHIHWYLNEPLAVYTLASNAWEISRTLLSLQGEVDFIEQIRSHHNLPFKSLINQINGPRNYVKHADRDADELILEVDAVECDTILFTACMDYRSVNGARPYAIELFIAWYAAIYPKNTGEFFRSEAEYLFPSLASMDRPSQITEAREALSRQHPYSAIRSNQMELTDNYRWVELRKKFG